MDTYPLISSTQNPKLKAAIALRESRARKKSGLFLVDGVELIQKALRGGFVIEQLFIGEDLADREVKEAFGPPDCDIFRVARNAFDKLQYGERSLQAIAVVRCGDVSLESLSKRLSSASQQSSASSPTNRPAFASKTILVLDRMEKPGNLGAALRTADATAVQAVLLADPICDLWNPNAVRSSLGALFTVPIAVGTELQVLDWLRQRGSLIFTARVEGSVDYTQVNFCVEHAIVIGNEAQGLQTRWQSGIEQAIHIPMLGQMDSLNASVSTAVLAYESLRQQKSLRSAV